MDGPPGAGERRPRGPTRPTGATTLPGRPPGPGGSSARAAGHRRQDHDGVAVGDARVEAVEHAHVLVVEVDVHVAVQLAVLGEELRLRLRVLRGEVPQHLADVAARGLDLLLAAN